MNQLISLAENILYTKDKNDKGEDVHKKHYELIFLVDQPEFIYTNEGSISRHRKIERQFITLTESQFDKLILQLQKMKDAKEEDLH